MRNYGSCLKKKQFNAVAGRIFAVSDDNEAEIIP